MNYSFPIIENIEQIYKAIGGYDEFIVKKDEVNQLLIVNYVFNTEKSFLHPDFFESEDEKINAAIRRECRGIEFDLITGNLVTRKFAKFFNVNEKPETMVGNIDWNDRHWVLEKLDGSMISVYKNLITDKIQYHTKMGLTNVAIPVNEYVKNSTIQYDRFFESCRLIDVSPLYEWCSRQQKIVIDYPDESLILTAMRHNKTGEYLSYEKMQNLAGIYGIPVVKALETTIENPHEFLKEVANFKDTEGVVVRFKSGLMVKIKASDYLRLHNSIDIVKFEKNIIDIIVNNQIDDLMPTLIGDNLQNMKNFVEDFHKNLLETCARLQKIVDDNRELDKKSFAVDVVSKLDKKDASVIFHIWNGTNAMDAVKNLLKKNCGSQTDVDKVRSFFGNICWMDYYKQTTEEE
jgi:T4 RnlA family RNA ligase